MLSDLCAEECLEIKGASSCPALLFPCAGTGAEWSRSVWEYPGSPPRRTVRQTWSFVEQAASLGFVASLPLADPVQ